MIFNLFFSGLSKKNKYAAELEATIISLFENYHIAWNNFCDQLGSSSNLPKLNLSIKSDSIYACLDEMDAAIKTLCTTVENVSSKLDLSEIARNPSIDFECLNLLLAQIAISGVSLISEASIGIIVFYLTRHFLLIRLMNTGVLAGSTPLLGEVAQVVQSSISTVPFARLTTLQNGIVIGTTAVVVLLMDLVLSIIEAGAEYSIVDNHIAHLQHIIGEISDIMIKETKSITNLTQKLKDGFIWLDSSHMILIDKENSNHSIISLEEFNAY
ncbi:MAG: hypothetical protein ACRCSG_03915 [Cellulosilyticaceae bacterium]